MNRIVDWFQNRKQKNAAWPRNMAVLYLLFIIVPLFVTDTIVFIMLRNYNRSDRTYSYEKAAENMEYLYGTVLDNASSIVMNVLRNDEFEAFLEKNYESNIDYYQEYRKVTNNKFLRALCSVNNSSLEIYTDNPTVINGGGIYSIARVSGSDWYKDYIESGQSTYVKFYYDTDSGPVSKPRRRLMVVKRMNYYPRDKYKKICRVLIDYGEFIRSIESVSSGESGFIADEEKICVFSDGNNNIYDDFVPLGELKRKTGYSRKFTYSGTDFTINIIDKPGSFTETMWQNRYLLLLMLAVNAVFPIFFASLTQTVQRGKLKEQEMDIARQQAELLALHSQINPHFLFNALESIRMHSVLRGEDETAEMVEKLAVIERKNADWNDDYTTIENEMDVVDAYLKLQQYRFGDRLSYEIDVDENCRNAKIPKLTIVTFVENACVHGIEGKSSPGWIFVRVYTKDMDMIIEIEDTGEGISDEDVEVLRRRMEEASIGELKQKGRIGVVNACLRLKIATENKVRFMIESEKGIGTTIGVVIPRECTNEKSIVSR